MSKKTNSYKTQKGFTLVELAIVLVIIGLIVSSVLVGQDLIKAAQLRATVRQFNEFQVGVNTFIGKYNGVPGDVINATSFGLSSSDLVAAGTTAGKGDGNGIVQDGTPAVAAYTGEIRNFWSHLSAAGKELISGTYSATACSPCTAGIDFPALKFGSGGWGVYGDTTAGSNYLYAGAASPSTAAATTMTNPFVPVDAYNIDAKVDDGLPGSGDVQAGGNVLTTFVTTLAPSATCVASSAYVMTTATAACGLRFTLQTF